MQADGTLNSYAKTLQHLPSSAHNQMDAHSRHVLCSLEGERSGGGSWDFVPPAPLQAGASADWPIPHYTLPDRCQEIADDELVTQEPNHPCSFLAKEFQLPAMLNDVLPSNDTLPFR